MHILEVVRAIFDNGHQLRECVPHVSLGIADDIRSAVKRPLRPAMSRSLLTVATRDYQTAVSLQENTNSANSNCEQYRPYFVSTSPIRSN